MENTDKPNQYYDYTQAGFDNFLTRSIDNTGSTGTAATSRQLNFDSMQTSGSLGNLLKVGNITLDGIKGQIYATDDAGNIFFIIGELDG
jgi:hypothetical protein